MAKKLYVGNLPYTITEDELKEVFARNGEVQSVRIITDAVTGRSKGFGFVEMTSDEDAGKAIAGLNGTALSERTINVSEARPQREKTGGFGGGRGPGFRGGYDRNGGGRKRNNWR